jgi:large subunit ribosomal protein L29
MKASDLREKSVTDLRELEKSLVHDVFQNRLKNFTNRLDDTSTMRKTKRDLARVVTVLREQALGIVRTGAPATAKTEAEAPAPKPAKAPKAPKAEVKAASEDKPKKAPAKKAAAKATKKGEAK